MRRILFLIALVGLSPLVHAAVEADILVAYDNSHSDSVGGNANAEVLALNAVAASNLINERSGSPARMRICGYHKTWWQANRSTVGGYVGWLGNYGDGNLDDVTAAADARGADLVAFICQGTDTGIAAVANQPGRYAAYQPSSFWANVVAHESGGHNYSLDHRVGRENPKTIMLHNYCGGGSQGYYSNPNLWLNNAKLLGEGSCLGAAVQGGDAAATLRDNAQGVADRNARVTVAPNLGSVVRRWQFNQPAGSAPNNTTVTDQIGGTAQVTVLGTGATYSGNGLVLPGGTSGSGAAYLQLPSGVTDGYTNITLEIWATPLSARNWARIFDFNNGTTGNYVMLASSVGTNLNTQKFESNVGGTAKGIESGLPTVAGMPHHYVATFQDNGGGGGTWFHYRDGELVAWFDVAYNLSTFADTSNWLGRSVWANDDRAHCEYAEVRLSNVAMNLDQIQANYLLGPNHTNNATVTMTGGDPTNGWGANSFATSGMWSNGLAPSGGNHYETYGHTLWTPRDGASYTFAGSSLRMSGGTMLWNNWADSALTINDFRLNGGEIINLGLYEFRTLTLAGNLTVETDSKIRAQGGEIAVTASLGGSGDLLHIHNYVTLSGNNTAFTGRTTVGDGRTGRLRIDSEERLGANPAAFTPNQLELDRGTLETTQTMALDDPNRGIRFGVNGGTLNVSGGTLTVSSAISSPDTGGNPTSGSIRKTGAGTLILGSTTSTFNGTVSVDSGSSSANDGILRVTSSQALAGARSPIQILNNNSGRSTLELAGGITLDKWVELNGRNNTTPAIRNISGDNTMQGLLLGAGGADYRVQSDSGLLTMTTPLQSGVTGNRTLTFQGSGDIAVTSAIQHGSADQLNVVKTGTGSLTLTAANTFAGAVTISGGTLYANPGNAATNRAFSYVSGITVNNGGTLRAGPNGLFGWDGTQEKPITVNSGATLVSNGELTTDVGVGLVTLNGGTLATLAANATDWGSWRFDNDTDKLAVTADSTVSAARVKFGSPNAAIEVSPGRTLDFTGTITDTANGGISYLRKTGTGTLTLAGANTFTGATSLDAGTTLVNGSLGNTAVTVASGATLGGNGPIGGGVTIQAGGRHALAVAATPGAQVTRSIGGALDLTAIGDILDLTAATQPAFGSYMLVTASGGITGGIGDTVVNLNGISNGSVAVVGNSLVLTVSPASAYSAWALAKGLTELNNGPNQDPDFDGIWNVLEFVLGGNPLASDTDILPTATTTATDFVFSFNRTDESEDEVDLTFEYSPTMASGAWTQIAIGENGAPSGPEVVITENAAAPDTITVTVPVGANVKLFGRLEAMK